ncbi:MAG: ABC transporter ATP-binding protein, partial [Muribaculaceae bacterium]|nr:ABC transporter ATP-binding protein [Muribaculaceae bacterium]
MPPYKKHLVLNVLFNILAAFLTLFSFALIIPILEMLFGINQAHYEFMPLGAGSVKDVVVNDFYYTVQCIIERYGNSTALAVIAGALVVMTALKTGSAYLAAYNMIAIRTGVVRDIRNQIYNRIVGLPIGFFSNERKGDVMARMSGDVTEVENSIMS